MNNWVIEAQDVGLHFKGKAKGDAGVTALQQVSMRIPAGQLVALVGPDGAGKTSMMRLLTGLMHPTTGHLRVLGMEVSQEAQAIQNRISYMPQRFGLYEDLSVKENFELYADLHGVSQDMRRERYTRLMQMMDLTPFASRLAGQLSGGMKQKLGLACTLVRSPELLLLDEPTVGVDPLSRRDLWQIVTQLVRDEQLSVVLATTYLDEAEKCAQVFIMHEGQILTEGSPSDITHHADGLCYTVETPKEQSSRVLQAQLYDCKDMVIDAVPQGGMVHLIRQPEVTQAQVQALIPNMPLMNVPARLEDGFMVILNAHVLAQQKSNGQQAATVEHNLSPQKIMNHEVGREFNKPETMIEVKDLVRTFGDFTAVASTSFSVMRGEVLGLLGPNGAGKTTTFRMLCGLLPATSGFLQVAGVNLRDARAQARRNIGYVSQKFALYGNLTVAENLNFFGQAYGLKGESLRKRTETVLKQFDLQADVDKPSGQLPGGFKQRLAMAVALLHEPEVLFLDEPTSGADPLARRAFWRRITALSDMGTTIIITTHFMEEAEYCDRIVIQDAGHVLAMGTPNVVRQQTGVHYSTMDEAFIGIVEGARTKQHKEVEHA